MEGVGIACAVDPGMNFCPDQIKMKQSFSLFNQVVAQSCISTVSQSDCFLLLYTVLQYWEMPFLLTMADCTELYCQCLDASCLKDMSLLFHIQSLKWKHCVILANFILFFSCRFLESAFSENSAAWIPLSSCLFINPSPYHHLCRDPHQPPPRKTLVCLQFVLNKLFILFFFDFQFSQSFSLLLILQQKNLTVVNILPILIFKAKKL